VELFDETAPALALALALAVTLAVGVASVLEWMEEPPLILQTSSLTQADFHLHQLPSHITHTHTHTHTLLLLLLSLLAYYY